MCRLSSLFRSYSTGRDKALFGRAGAVRPLFIESVNSGLTATARQD